MFFRSRHDLSFKSHKVSDFCLICFKNSLLLLKRNNRNRVPYVYYIGPYIFTIKIKIPFFFFNWIFVWLYKINKYLNGVNMRDIIFILYNARLFLFKYSLVYSNWRLKLELNLIMSLLNCWTDSRWNIIFCLFTIYQWCSLRTDDRTLF